mmetsp:Transcript_13834/g.14967  ORF Transcript_13834/g.14967 Transcript_13834/m.14967 type:complete len:252 (-) Transcript_13834:42-797(-)
MILQQEPHHDEQQQQQVEGMIVGRLYNRMAHTTVIEESSRNIGTSSNNGEKDRRKENHYLLTPFPIPGSRISTCSGPSSGCDLNHGIEIAIDDDDDDDDDDEVSTDESIDDSDCDLQDYLEEEDVNFDFRLKARTDENCEYSAEDENNYRHRLRGTPYHCPLHLPPLSIDFSNVHMSTTTSPRPRRSLLLAPIVEERHVVPTFITAALTVVEEEEYEEEEEDDDDDNNNNNASATATAAVAKLIALGLLDR